jgi:serine/threonine protein kinase
MPTPPATAGGDRVLHVSPARTVVARANAVAGGLVVAKQFVTGSPADAERELAMGCLAAGPGVIEHLQVITDPASQRPMLLTRAESGLDLDRLVAEHGALPAVRACAWLLPVAETLARLHGLRTAGAPAGLCHGDIKPKNLLRTESTTLLLDFEHSQPIATARDHAVPFTGGTAGFTAPEVARGATPSAGLDVYALGATWSWLLAGGGPRVVPQHRAVQSLLTACLAEDPRLRPSAAALAAGILLALTAAGVKGVAA